MKVHTQLKTWREKSQRLRQWLKPDHAAGVLHDRRLADLVARAPSSLPAKGMSNDVRATRRVRPFQMKPSRRREIAGRAQLRLGQLRRH
jgi:hypothetical protein